MIQEESETVETLNNQLEKAYVAGFVDGNSTLNGFVSNDDEYKLGYRIQCKIQITKSLPFGIDVVHKFCNKNAIMSTLQEFDTENGTRYRFQISNEYDIQKFLNMIYPYLRDRREEADLLANRIAPIVNNNEYNTKSEFMDLMEDIDSLREMNPHVTRSKYTKEYFENEWSDQ